MMNCAGYALGIDDWVRFDSFTKEAYDEIRLQIYSPDYHDITKKIDDIMVRDIAEEVCRKYNMRIIDCNAYTAPVGCVAVRVGTGMMTSDFHFAKKELFCGEEVWMHKLGRESVDIMFSEEIESNIWLDFYNSETIYLVSSNQKSPS